MEPDKIKNVMNKFDFKERPGLLLFWEYRQVGCEEVLRVGDLPFVSTHDKKGFKKYRKRCISYGYVSVGPAAQVDQVKFAGLAAQKRNAAYQRTSRDPNQCLGQLVVPVFYNEGADEKFAGVIELTTHHPKTCYDAEFNQIKKLLEDEKLSTKPLAKTIEV